MNRALRTIASLVPCAVVAAACGGTAGQTGAPASESTANQQSNLLASIAIEEGHSVEFRETAAGEVILIETGKVFQAPVIAKANIHGKTLSQVYRMASPTGEIPAALAAKERLRSNVAAPAVQAPPPSLAAPPAIVTGSGAGPKLYNASEQTWFANNFCHYPGSPACANSTCTLSPVNCLQGWDWAHSGWIKGGGYNVQTLVGSEGSQTATFNVFGWNGSSQTLDWSHAAPPGTWWFYDYFVTQSWNWHHADLDGAGGNTQVSEASEDCGEGNEWSCYNDACGGNECDPATSTDQEVVGINGECLCVNL